MKEYKCIKIEEYGIDTETRLNLLTKAGWEVVCSYARNGNWLILERDKKVCRSCGKWVRKSKEVWKEWEIVV